MEDPERLPLKTGPSHPLVMAAILTALAWVLRVPPAPTQQALLGAWGGLSRMAPAGKTRTRHRAGEPQMFPQEEGFGLTVPLRRQAASPRLWFP